MKKLAVILAAIATPLVVLTLPIKPVWSERCVQHHQSSYSACIRSSRFWREHDLPWPAPFGD